jgi:hypothetical protein
MPSAPPHVCTAPPYCTRSAAVETARIGTAAASASSTVWPRYARARAARSRTASPSRSRSLLGQLISVASSTSWQRTRTDAYPVGRLWRSRLRSDCGYALPPLRSTQPLMRTDRPPGRTAHRTLTTRWLPPRPQPPSLHAHRYRGRAARSLATTLASSGPWLRANTSAAPLARRPPTGRTTNARSLSPRTSSPYASAFIRDPPGVSYARAARGPDGARARDCDYAPGLLHRRIYPRTSYTEPAVGRLSLGRAATRRPHSTVYAISTHAHRPPAVGRRSSRSLSAHCRTAGFITRS